MKKILLFLFAAICMVGCNQNNAEKNLYVKGFVLHETLKSGYFWRYEVEYKSPSNNHMLIKTDYSGFEIISDYFLPLTSILPDPVLLPYDGYYYIRAIYSSDVENAGIVAVEERVKKADLMGKREYVIESEDPQNGTKIGLLLETK